MGEWRWALPRVLAIFLAARLIVVACALGAEWLAPTSSAGPGGSLLRGDERPLLRSLTTWDGVYFLGIARDGYQAGPVNGPYPETVFFPLYPALTAAVAAPLGGDVALAGVLVANAAALLGLAAAYALARRRLGRPPALMAAAFVALQPGAVAFAMSYSDALFLALTCLSLLAADLGTPRGRAAAGILSFLAGLTRLQGALLLVPLFAIFWQQDGGRPNRSWLAALGGTVGLLAFCGYIGVLTGDPLAPILGQGAWDFGAVSGAVAEPWVIVIAAVIYGATALAALKGLRDRWRARRDDAGVLWGVANIAALIAARRVASLPRYLAPVTGVAEEVAIGPAVRRMVQLALALSIAGFGVIALLHFTLKLAP